MKRFLDVLFALAGLVLLGPGLLLLAALVKAASPGPVFYMAVRSGKGGVPFRMFKFRTMVENADSLGGPSSGLDDPRVTPLGRWLRRHKIDELPQLINVLKGDMSLVGPRPEVPLYTREYAGEELLILTVRPGITDLASLAFSRLDEVLGREEPDRVYEEQVRPRKNALRVKYVKERSLLLDFQILFRTLGRVLFRL